MKRDGFRLPAAALIILLTAAGSAVAAGPPSGIGGFTEIYALGDSLTDTGNFATVLACGDGLVTPQNCPGLAGLGQPASDLPVVLNAGRFSNEDLYIDMLDTQVKSPGAALAAALGGKNRAFAGTLSNPNLAPYWPPYIPGTELEAQAKALIQSEGRLKSRGLVVIFIGSNDLFAVASAFDGGTDVSAEVLTSAANVVKTIKYLSKKGGRNFLVFNSGNIGRSPIFQQQPPEVLTSIRDLTAVFNFSLFIGVAALGGDPSFAGNIWYVPTFAIGEFIASPLGRALTGLTSTTPCAPALGLNQDCSTSQFWDFIHPTKGVHAIFADSAKALLKQQPLVRR